jgi:hypothetical protein
MIVAQARLRQGLGMKLYVRSLGLLCNSDDVRLTRPCAELLPSAAAWGKKKHYQRTQQRVTNLHRLLHAFVCNECIQ